MFHRKRFKLAIAVILVLLLTAALAPAAAAQQDVGDQGPPPADTGDDDDDGDGNGDPVLPGNGDNGGTDPVLPGNGNGNGNGDNGGTDPVLPGNGNGNGNGDNGGTMMGAPANWPPPNAIVHHAATPIQISSLEGGLQVYFIGADGATHGPLLASLSKLAEMHPDGDPVQLFSGTNPGTGKPVTIQYLPGAKVLHVNTFYADKPPHDYNKAYIFTVDADHSVNHERW